jgi:hypothetical protein
MFITHFGTIKRVRIILCALKGVIIVLNLFESGVSHLVFAEH